MRVSQAAIRYAANMTGILLAVAIAIIVYPQARNAWGDAAAVAVAVVGMGLALTLGLLAVPYFAVGLYARQVAMKKAIAGADEPPAPS